VVEWQAPAHLTVDAGRDANSDREDVKLGLMPESDHYAMRGQDRKKKRDLIELEVTDLIVRAQRIAKATNVSVDLALAMLKQSTPNGLATPTQPAQPQQGGGKFPPKEQEKPKEEGGEDEPEKKETTE
jgi:hypothetical protein